MCDYQGYEFGAGAYPDSVCVEGRLFDADDCDSEGRLHDRGEYVPCPICDKESAIEWWYSRWEGSLGKNDNPKAEIECAEIDAHHMAAAIHLVNDIRNNRGVV